MKIEFLKKELKDTLSLMDSNWKSRILVRSSNNVYNQSLISAMIHNYGRKTTKDFLINFTKNFARILQVVIETK